ncbi:hypothetical protein [Pseudomonas viridiflava]|uniref:hypothetical protein n=1 Tax=Pseudomonas viridiflava TaxID=33069 RepID=UPI000F02B688|nr:hypothetical protein [Pseudomonas viridiflava]
MKQMSEALSVIHELEGLLEEIHDEIMPPPMITGEEKNWDCVPFDEFDAYSPMIAGLIDEAYSYGLSYVDKAINLLWDFIDENTYHMMKPEVWIRRTTDLATPPLEFFLKNTRYYSEKDALWFVKGLPRKSDPELIDKFAHVVGTTLQWQRYDAAQFALDQWRNLTYENKQWTRDYANIVLTPIIDGMDFTNVLPGAGLKSFMTHNQSDLLHCIHQSRFGLSAAPVAPVRLLSALKNAGLDGIFHPWGEYTFAKERNPEVQLYTDLDRLGVVISRDELLAHMSYSSTGSQWLEAFRLLMMRGELIELHEVCTPTINGQKRKPGAPSSVPGPNLQMGIFINLLEQLCEKGDSPRAAALHYISELVQTDEQMPNRLIEAGLPRDFLEIAAVRDKNFMMDLGL